jgi:tRNA threonylcarbamoyladenosine biosynthesis protein TsaE
MLYMNTTKTVQIESLKPSDTFSAGKRLGQKCKGGEIFILSSDLGGGKTTFVKGLASGLGCIDQVGSPTYTINRVYSCAHNIELQHFDFYRLHDAGIVAHELSEIIHETGTVIAIEWGDIVTDILPSDRVELTIERKAEHEESRHITVTYTDLFAYLFEDSE